LETGQSATIDAPLVLELITSAALAVTPHAQAVLDVGCGAGNYPVKLLQKKPGLDVTLIDLSRPMLDRAVQRLRAAGAGAITPIQGDIRDIALPDGQFDIVLATAVLHHLREESQWEAVFAKLYRAICPGGSLWISDLVEHTNSNVHQLMWQRYGEYLTGLKGEPYRDQVFAYIEQEDTPRSLMFQLDLLRRVGFTAVEPLHKNGPFAAFGAIKGQA
jgi:tRNA (cmo5U34)-methyltransferase